METEQQTELLAAAADFLKIQKAQRDALTAGRLEGMHGWRGVREKAFARLRKCLANLVAVSQGEQEVIAALGDQLEELLRHEAELAAAVAKRRRKMQEQLFAIRKGKKMLRKYSCQGGAGVPPRFLSNTT